MPETGPGAGEPALALANVENVGARPKFPSEIDEVSHE